MPRSALIVDDSRTALVALSRLLKDLGIATDTAESGPEALDYLHSNSPGVIFLDHMMPGMDGFETLAALKSNVLTSAIPVVMYTSREGDAYMGQALVQGAFGVLQKPVNPEELGKILKHIDRLRMPPTATGASARTTPGRSGRPRAAVTGVIHVPSEFRSRPGSPNPATTQAHSGNRNSAIGNEGRKPIRAWPWGLFMRRAMVALILLMPAAWYFEQYQQAERLRQQLQQENLALRDEQRVAREQAEAREIIQSQQYSDTPPHTLKASRGLLETVAWALNQHSQFKLNEDALDDARLALLRELIARLAAAGFQGSVRLETHIGQFCLVRDEQGNPREPIDSLSFSRCEVVSYPPAQAAQLSRRQSPAFSRYLADRRPSNPIQITVVPHGATRPLVAYPDISSVQDAGDWNQIARLNQRVEIVLVPKQQ